MFAGLYCVVLTGRRSFVLRQHTRGVVLICRLRVVSLFLVAAVVAARVRMCVYYPVEKTAEKNDNGFTVVRMVSFVCSSVAQTMGVVGDKSKLLVLWMTKCNMK